MERIGRDDDSGNPYDSPITSAGDSTNSPRASFAGWLLLALVALIVLAVLGCAAFRILSGFAPHINH
jgi:hypothetical protein